MVQVSLCLRSYGFRSCQMRYVRADLRHTSAVRYSYDVSISYHIMCKDSFPVASTMPPNSNKDTFTNFDDFPNLESNEHQPQEALHDDKFEPTQDRLMKYYVVDGSEQEKLDRMVAAEAADREGRKAAEQEVPVDADGKDEGMVELSDTMDESTEEGSFSEGSSFDGHKTETT